MRALPLRLLMVLLIVSVAGAGLATGSVGVTALMRESVFTRIDRELADAADSWAWDTDLFKSSNRHPMPTDYVVYRFIEGTEAMSVTRTLGSAPDIRSLPLDDRPHTVPATPDSRNDADWRVTSATRGGVTIVVGRSMAAELLLIRRLRLIQVLIWALVMLVTLYLSYALVKRALAPLREMERTAEAIAEGDFARRLPEYPPATEVGQLAATTNFMLEELNAALGRARDKEEQMRRFVGDASHELRTPLTSMRGYAELYRSGATTDLAYVLEKIESESQRMTGLVENLLSLSRSEGRAVRKRPVDLLELALSIMTDISAAHPGRHVMVKNDAPDIPIVAGDAGQLHQVLLNLVTNALVHGGPEAEVTVRFAQDAPGWVVLEVSDTGACMTPEVAAHIFERFYRADKSRSRRSGGSGLGLAIVSSIIEAHGGTVTVRSTPGEGATFTVRLARPAA